MPTVGIKGQAAARERGEGYCRCSRGPSRPWHGCDVVHGMNEVAPSHLA